MFRGPLTHNRQGRIGGAADSTIGGYPMVRILGRGHRVYSATAPAYFD